MKSKTRIYLLTVLLCVFFWGNVSQEKYGTVQAAPATETLWGIAQACGFAITNPANSVDSLFNDSVASCNGDFAKGKKAWTYTDFDSGVVSFASLTSVTLDIRFYFDAAYIDDEVLLRVSSDNGLSWTTLDTFNAGNLPPSVLTTNSYDVTALFTPATLIDAQVEILGNTKIGTFDVFTIYLDEARLVVNGNTADTPPTVTITAPADGSSFPDGTNITFTGTAADPEDGDISASLSWTSNLDGAIGAGASFSISTLSVGVHTITASVTDSGGNTTNSSITVTITAVGDTPPTVTIIAPADGSSFPDGTNITFTSTATDPEDGDISASLSWTSNLDGAIGAGASFSISTLSVGVHTITASVTDSGGNTVNSSITVTITAVGDTPPTVTITAPANGTPFSSGATINFTGTATDPEDGNISASLTWTSNIDGAIGSGAGFSLVLSDGVHTITASVTDSGGNTVNVNITITVGSIPSPHGSYSATTDNCAACHRTHTSPSPGLVAGPTGNAFCYTCHDGTGASVPPVVSTHSNVDFAGAAEPTTFELECIQCHDPHGSSNLHNIKEYVEVTTSPLLTTGPINFTALTGANSFDDGTSPVVNRLCVSCHADPSNPGFPMTNHDGGANHGGGSNYEGQDCTNCHLHSSDANLFTKDGFMASGGSCTTCHSSTQGSRRQIVGVGGDFQLTTHHVNGVVQDSDCEVCHDTTNHTAGKVELLDVDTGTTITLNADPNTNAVEAAKMDAFCLACHDANGAAGSAPFSDLIMPPIMDAAAWNPASHNLAGSCFDCHNNGHGSIKQKILAPWDNSDGSLPEDLLREEEGFCYNCHDGDGPATSDMQALFSQTSHHKVGSLEQADGSKVECINCHNPHRNTPEQPLSDPDDLTVLWDPADGDRDFCLRCHDGAPPAGVTFPATFTGFGWDKSAYVGSKHDDNLGGNECQACHFPHGSNIYSLLTGTYRNVWGGTVSDFSEAGGEFDLCFNCHKDTLITGSNAWAGEHNSHDDDGPCIYCHDAHAPARAGEAGLINFAYNNMFDDLLLQYSSKGTDYFTDLDTSYERLGDPQCGITCHGANHAAKGFTANPIDTVACNQCHDTAQGGRRQVLDSNGDGTGAGGDFLDLSHHLAVDYNDYTLSSDCRVCHQFSTHRGGSVVMADPDSQDDIVYSGLDMNSLQSFCQGCHDEDGATRLATPFSPFSDGQLPVVVSTHSNAGVSGVGKAEADFVVACAQCHEGHGSTNLTNIKSNVVVNGGTTTGPVVFTAYTNADSFDEIDAADADDICAACHTNAANPGNPMVNHVGGDHSPLPTGDDRGNDCTACHTHDLDGVSSTLDGFMEASSAARMWNPPKYRFTVYLPVVMKGTAPPRQVNPQPTTASAGNRIYLPIVISGKPASRPTPVPSPTPTIPTFYIEPTPLPLDGPHPTPTSGYKEPTPVPIDPPTPVPSYKEPTPVPIGQPTPTSEYIEPTQVPLNTPTATPTFTPAPVEPPREPYTEPTPVPIG